MKLFRYLSPVTTLSLCTVASLASITTATAQITPDSSLGAESSVVNPNVVNGIDLITGGATRGSNLFHSFQEFNIGAGRGAYFSNPANITNILTRVTGGNPSNILGRLGVLGNANLFLLNPKGIFFGSNASLDLRGGSFFGTTADSVLFDNFEFSASNPQPVPQLTINIPIGLRFRDNPGNITNNAGTFGLGVESGKTLALVGGNVSLDGGIAYAPGGRVELGGLSQAGTIGLNPDGSLSFPSTVARGNISITNGAFVDVRGGGSIAVNAQNLGIWGDSFLVAGIDSELDSIVSQGGDIDIYATDIVSISDQSLIYNAVFPEGIGDAGDINIITRSLSLTNGAQLVIGNFGLGNAGDVNILASDGVALDGSGKDGFSTGIFNNLRQEALGNTGDINIATGSLSLTNGAVLYSSTFGKGNAGNITINALNTINFDGTQGFPGGVFSIVGAGGQGNSGDINITSGESLSLTNGSQISSFIRDAGIGNAGNIQIATGSLFITDGGELSTSSLGNGNAGSIFIRATDTVALTGAGSNVFSTSGSASAPVISIKLDDQNRPTITRVLDQQTKFPDATGNSGNINIQTSLLSVTDGARLTTSTSVRGDAGNIGIVASTIKFSGTDAKNSPSGAFSAVESGAVGRGGTINIKTSELTVDNGAQLVANTSGVGNAGFVKIDATDKVVLDGLGSDRSPSGIFTAVDSSGQGDGGTIYINTDSLFVKNGAQLSADARGQGNAGNLELRTNSLLELDNQGKITAQSVTGRGGDIKITTNDLVLLRRNSLISATSEGQNGIDGNITINTPFLVAFPSENSDIVATGSGRSAGSNVRINALGIFGIEYQPQLTPQSDIVATGSVGLFTLNTQEVGQVLPELPQNPTDPTQQIAQNPCQKGSGSSFTVTGRGGLPSSPSDGFSNNETRVDLVEPVASSSNSQAATTNEPLILTNTNKPIIPAQGWIFNSKGEVVLTAYDPTTTNTAQRSSKPTAACPAF
ncbi:filamentous hemagglutinin N-terminal domain-containing protein [Mastigocladus laminosus UU774]|nr:filamentous hemagglutinin N-terminal domain-containing protein [Mastigocladus laminosus UU774]